MAPPALESCLLNDGAVQMSRLQANSQKHDDLPDLD
jgi:hypothetical protein